MADAPVLTILRGSRDQADAIEDRLRRVEHELDRPLDEFVKMELQFIRGDLRCTTGLRKGKPISPRGRAAWLEKFVRLARTTGPLIEEGCRLRAELKALGRRAGMPSYLLADLDRMFQPDPGEHDPEGAA